MKKLAIALLLFLTGCGVVDLDDLVVTVTSPVGVTVTPESSLTPTAFPTPTPDPFFIPTPTPICSGDTCGVVIIEATPLGMTEWEYWTPVSFQIRCVSKLGCRVRKQPSLINFDAFGQPLYEIAAHNSVFSVEAIYHCDGDKLVKCDRVYKEWYYLTSGTYAAVTHLVWERIGE